MDQIPTAWPVLSDGAEARRTLRRAAGLLIDKVLDVRRLAVGEQMLLPVASPVKAYRALGKFLPSVKIDPEGSSDFFYRINRPRTVDLNGRPMIINRLSQWASLRLNLSIMAAEVSMTAILGYTDRLITDVNSTAEDDLSPLNVDQKNKVIDNLFAFSEEL